MVPVSICTIVKNEQQYIEGFLKAIIKAFDKYPYEIVLVDTGSDDQTIELAQKYIDNIYFFDWIDDFSAAKNYAIKQAKNNLILFLDCDEYVSDIDVKCFDKFVAQNEKALGIITLKNYLGANINEKIAVDELPRVFDRRFFQYENTVHEQLASLKKESKAASISLPIKVDHYGYMGDSEQLKRKVERNNNLLFKELKNKPDDAYIYYQLGKSYSMIEDYEKAYVYFGKGLEQDLDPKLDYVQEMVTGYGYAMLSTERLEEALSFEGIYDDFSSNISFVALMGIIYLRNNLLEKAVDAFLAAIEIPYSERDIYARNVPLYNLGLINEMMGNVDEAIHFYSECVEFGEADARLNTIRKSKC